MSIVSLDEAQSALVAADTVLLTVQVGSEEQAREIFDWLYSRSKPMKSTLIEVAWDKVAVPRHEAEALDSLRYALLTGKSGE